MFTLRATARWMCGILVLHAAAAAAVGQATAGGWLVRVFELDGPAAGVPELAVGQLPNLVRVTETLDLDTQRAGDFGPVHENILTMAEGVLTPPAAGRYTLRLTSDDGSLLWLDGRLVIDNDGLHGALPKDADVELSAAGQRIKVAHYQGGGDGVLRLEWKPAAAPAERFVMVPAAALGHDPNAVGQTAPGKKRMIPPLRKGRPGDGRPVTACHPGLRESNDAAAGASGLECLPGGFARYRGATVWVPGLTEFSAGLAENEAIVGSEGELKRLMLDPCDEATQGCVFRCSALPRGAVVRGPGAAFEMRAVHMLKNGIEIEFTEPLDARVGWDPEAYHIEQWPFDVASKQPPQRDGVVYPAGFASVSEDRTRVFVEVPGLKPGHVVYVRLLPPCLSDEGELPWATEAWYTLHTIPNDRMGTVRPAPAKAAENVLTAAEQAEGWKLLFDGRTSAGWRGWKKAEFPDGWQIRDGCLTRVGPGGDICTNEEFGDFELKIDWRIAPAGNSGIFFRASEEFDWCWRTAPEMQVLDNAEHADGRNPLTSAGSNYALQAPVRDVTQPVGLWNEARIVVRGPQVEYWLNGVQTVKYELGSPEWEKLVAASKFKEMPQYGRTKTGHIVLQDHGDRVWFRNIKIRKL